MQPTPPGVTLTTIACKKSFYFENITTSCHQDPFFVSKGSLKTFLLRCYDSGERLCKRQAVRFGFSQDDIDQCRFHILYFFKIFVRSGLAEPGAPDGELILFSKSILPHLNKFVF